MEACAFIDNISSSSEEEENNSSDEEEEEEELVEGEEIMESEESNIMKSYDNDNDADITEMEIGKQINTGQKRKRENNENDYQTKQQKTRDKEEGDAEINKVQQPCFSSTDNDHDELNNEMIFDNDEDEDESNVCNDEWNLPLSPVDTFLANIKKEENEAIKNDIGALKIISRMNMDNEEDFEIVTNVFQMPLKEVKTQLLKLDTKYYSNLYDSKARKTLAILKFLEHDTHNKFDVNTFVTISRDILAVPVVSTLMKQNYNDNFLSELPMGQEFIKSFKRLNKCITLTYKYSTDFSFLNMEEIQFSQETIRKSLSNIRTKLTDYLEDILLLSKNQQKIGSLDKMTPQQIKNKMNYTMGRWESIMKFMYGPLFKLKKPGKSETESYVFKRNETLAKACKWLDFGLKTY